MTDERVLVVPRDSVFPEEAQQGFISGDLRTYMERMQTAYAFKPRCLVEDDPSFKQLIPYVVFVHSSSVFLVRRSALQSEQRLAGMHSIGIGGHINRDDAVSDAPTCKSGAAERFASVLVEGLNREVREEVYLDETPDLSLVGLINDDSTSVGRVHLGLVYIAQLVEPSVTVRETELMVGSFVQYSTLNHYYATMETWSQIVIDSGCLRTDGHS